MRLSRELQIGKAGEYLVCADLIIKGFVAFPSEQGLPYDIILDDGSRMLRVQVKTCEAPREVPQRTNRVCSYMFNVKRHGKHGSVIYGDDEVDIFALVALDIRQVGYIDAKKMKQTLSFRVDKLRGTYYDERGEKDYHEIIKMRKDNPEISQREIARRMNLDAAYVNRLLKPGYKPYVTGARYFSDIVRDSEWFKTI